MSLTNIDLQSQFLNTLLQIKRACSRKQGTRLTSQQVWLLNMHLSNLMIEEPAPASEQPDWMLSAIMQPSQADEQVKPATNREPTDPRLWPDTTHLFDDQPSPDAAVDPGEGCPFCAISRHPSKPATHEMLLRKEPRTWLRVCEDHAEGQGQDFSGTEFVTIRRRITAQEGK